MGVRRVEKETAGRRSVEKDRARSKRREEERRRRRNDVITRNIRRNAGDFFIKI